MRTGRVPTAAFLLILATFVLQVSGGDLYWEGEEDASNEYLEVKDEGLSAHHRFKRKPGFFDFDFLGLSQSTTTESYGIGDEDPRDDREDLDADGSGLPDILPEPEPKERTLRVTFMVMEPYRPEYSNRDSPEFQNFSRSLADAVDELYESLPGTQRATLVRIQSVSDEFSCKVTLDILTTGNEDTDRITSILRDHISKRMILGKSTVSDKDFSATVMDPGAISPIEVWCASNEFRCDDGNCVALTARCNGQSECKDGSDESGCPNEPDQRVNTTPRENVEVTELPIVPKREEPLSAPRTETPRRGDDVEEYYPATVGPDSLNCSDPIACEYSEHWICPHQKCNGIVDCSRGEDEENCDVDNSIAVCARDELSCDGTRCLPLLRRCDGRRDCDDGKDEENCGDQSCGIDDFKCRDGKCIDRSHQCDRIVDCPNGEDEFNCNCTANEFRCVQDGNCIEARKRCDQINHCSDSSDESDCAVGYFRCRTGKLIPEHERCNRRYDCPPGDYSDEQNCPCGADDFRCDNGHCIPASKHCDRTHDCQDRSDERDCIYGKTCMAYEYKCTSGQCVPAESSCNGTVECDDGSDEKNCPCKRDEFQCRDGSCINIALRCNGHKNCKPYGEDEFNCGAPCPSTSFACPATSSIPCATRCDGQSECSDGEDENNCGDEECSLECDGRCIDDADICNGFADCIDGSDEENCDNCEGPDDFRCGDGTCINTDQRCNGYAECVDSSDEFNCSKTINIEENCRDNEFTCKDGSCIQRNFVCDGTSDCADNSDEENCPCKEYDWSCRSGQCIAITSRCDGVYDCTDYSDEDGCPTLQPNLPPYEPVTTARPVYTTVAPTRPPYLWPDNTPSPVDNRPYQPDDNRPYQPDGNRPYQPGDNRPYHPGDNRPYQPGDSRPYQPDDDRPYQPDDNGPYQPGDNRPYQPGDNRPYQPDDNRPYQPDDNRPYQPDDNRPYQPPTNNRPNRPRPNQPANPQPGWVPPLPPDTNPQGCNRNQWRCENGPCIDAYRRCDGHVDCPRDSSDEFDCPPGSPLALNLKTYPDQQTMRNGGDVVFQCRDEGPQRAPVRWVREGGRPLKPGSTDRNGRLEMNGVTPNDGGVYICQVPKYLGQPGAELRVTLVVESARATQRPPFPACQTYEATCGNGQCISKSAVCDGKRDCSDGSDEDACDKDGRCEPNQFQCRNRRCILKTWLCDSEDDCLDGSDELNCGVKVPGAACLPNEFACEQSEQCIPKSFHCDGQSDCRDHTDEIGCAPVHITKPPQPSNLRLNPGDTLTLTCEAVGVPTPLLSWRLNWGHVPPKCSSTSEFGISTLNCPDIQPEDSGAYSCEALNNKGTTFAAPDAIVYVNKTTPCRNGYFNSEARQESDCIRCFCFGKSTQCHSADLFIYNMQTPLGQGGTRLVGVKQGYNGDVSIDSSPIDNEYYYQPLINGATVTKLVYAQRRPSNVHPYLTLPETYNRNQLTSYGGHIKYQISPHSPKFSYDNLPDIIIKGKYSTLVYNSQRDGPRNAIEARLTPENWRKSDVSGLVPATREDIMMALDNVELILLRADQNDAGVNITNFVMESAQSINAGLGIANLIEECSCPPGYEGLSCEKCASGYARKQGQQDPWLGNCVPEQPEPCPAGTYGAPESGYACKPCPCPLTNRENQFARTCGIGPNGDVVCDCAPGYEGSHCEYCSEGYEGNPLTPGDSCRPKPADNCNPIGTSQVRPPDECLCKDNVQGRYCDQCKNDSFYLSQDFRHGCASCFCTGVSQQCTSSNLRRKTTSAVFNIPQIVDQVKVYTSAPTGSIGNQKYNTPRESSLVPTLARGEIALNNIDWNQPSIYYWSLPFSFAGDKVTSYGGHLRYLLRHVPLSGGQISRNNAPDVQLISDNSLTFHHFGDFAASSDGTLNASVQFLEKGWLRPDGKEISREHFLLALADVSAILIKASYSPNSQLATLVSASIETAEPDGDGAMALHVEQCVCPPGYVGTSCEDCAPGYTRSSDGLYLEHCERCECNGHSKMCNPETGVCYACTDNTDGPNCESCKPGYERDIYQNCVPSYQTSPQPGCNCDAAGSETLDCDAYGRCQCKQNVEGQSCNQCRRGTFGLDANYPFGCHECYCSGVTADCHEASHYSRIPMPAPIIGEDYGGYSLMNLNADRVINNQFVSAINESELIYIFSFPPDEELFWSLPVFPGNRLNSYGGKLSLTQKFETGGYSDISEPGIDVVLVGDSLSVYWSHPTPLRANEPLSYTVPLVEQGWSILNDPRPATRNDFMSVLKNVRRVLVRATLSKVVANTAIADVSMDTATEYNAPNAERATGVEVCMCPEGYRGLSCESCLNGYYKDQWGNCRQCECNGNDCQLNAYNQVVCNCKPGYTGRDCTTVEREPTPDVTTRLPPPQSSVVIRITSPKIKIQEVGSSVNFTCQAQSIISDRRLPVTWSKVDGYLPLDRTQTDSNSGLLIITNLQISDSGTYICQTSDGVSTDQAIATLKVPGNDMTVPTVELTPHAREYYEGDRIELECRVSGNPTPSITWQRGDRRALPHSGSYTGSYFYIDQATIEDSGEYLCIASNAVDKTVRSAVVTVRPRPSQPSRERLSISPTASNVAEGASTRVVCTGTANVPPGSIGWSRQDGRELSDNVRSDNGVLYIDIARLDNRGVYLCRTTSSDVTPISVVVTVIPTGTPSPDEAPSVTISVNTTSIPTGESGSVECFGQGYPQPLIRWSKHGGDFGPTTSQRDNTLLISSAREGDQGYYLCEGTVDGQVVDSKYVLVEIERREKPRVEIWPQGEQAVPFGTEFEFMCRVTGGIPTPDVMWDRSGGRPLPPYAHIEPHNVLKFDRVEINDEGEYTCTATNKVGSDSASAYIKVRSPPEIIFTPNNFITANIGDPITVECRARGYPEPTVSIKSNSDYRELVPSQLGRAVYRIPSVTERDEGEYVCTATSLAGTTEEPFVIRIEDGEPRGDIGFDNLPEGSGDEFINPGGNNGYDNNNIYGENYNNNNNYNNYNNDPNIQPGDMIAIEGRESKISCNASDAFDVVWSRAGYSDLQRNAGQVGNQLIIYNTTKNDAGQYECTLYDKRTREAQQSAVTVLRVMAAPRIRLEPQSQTVHPGDSPTVRCLVDGDEILEILWKPVTKALSQRVEIRSSTLIFHQIEVEDAGEYECFARNAVANASAVAEVIVSGPRQSNQLLATVEQPRQPYRVGDNVQVICKASGRDIRVEWGKPGTSEYVVSRPFGGGAVLEIPNIKEADAGVYRCTARDPYRHVTYDDFNLEVQPGAPSIPYPYPNEGDQTYTARLGDVVDLPCQYNLEQPVSISWSREYGPLSANVKSNDPNLHLQEVSESDAGTYICRVSNGRATVESRAILRVLGVNPQFNGDGWLSIPTLKDSFFKFDIEVSFKPTDNNGLILYTTSDQADRRSADFLALQLVDGIPQFLLNTGIGTKTLNGDRPLTLNAWHTIRLNRSSNKITMDVDNMGPFSTESADMQWSTLELNEPLYIGGVPNLPDLPEELSRVTGFMGCISMLVLGREERNLKVDAIEKYNVGECDTCNPNNCMNGGVCQEDRNELGYSCLCPAGFAGRACERRGEACRAGLCGRGKCTDTADGYKCACPITHTGKNCEIQQNIEYPAFTGGAYLAIRPRSSSRTLRMSMNIKANAPVADGIIMYCAESARGYGGFVSLVVKDRRIELRIDVGDGNRPVILTSPRILQANEWTKVIIRRMGGLVSLKINTQDNVEGSLSSPKKDLQLETPMFVGGVDESITLNNNTGVVGGFNGCIKDVEYGGTVMDIVNSSILSSNVQECSNQDRGDIPEMDTVCQCRNGGTCPSDSTVCVCPPGFSGAYCESRVSPSSYRRTPADPCAATPCKNGGTCKLGTSSRFRYACDCPLGFAGATCQLKLELLQSVGFNGNGYIELPAEKLRYDRIEDEPVVIALAVNTHQDGVLLYQKQISAPPGSGDFILLRVERGVVVMEWDNGGGKSSVTVPSVLINDGERHSIVAQLFADNTVTLAVDGQKWNGRSNGLTSYMNADSNVYIGGIPERLNVYGYPGLTGCFEQVELMNSKRGLNLGQIAVAARNTQRCRDTTPAS